MTEPRLRPYQAADATKIEYNLKANRRTLYVLPTGGGKTITFSHLAKKWVENGGNVIFVTHRDFLVSQTALAIYQMTNFAPICIVQERTAREAHALTGHALINTNFVVTMIGRAGKAKKFINKKSLIIIDEGHHAVAKTWLDFLQFAHEAGASILGVTATPERLDGRGLREIFDVMICGPSIKWLTDNDYLTPHKVISARFSDYEKLRVVAGEYKALEIDQIFGDPVGLWKFYAENHATIAFTHSISAAEKLKNMFLAADISAATIHSKLTDRQRRTAVKALAERKIKVLVSVDVISEGFDVPLVECVIMQRKTASLQVYLQQIGRGLRKSDGKDALVVIDNVGNVHQHGFADDDRNWSLDAPRRKKLDRSAFTDYRGCPNCGFTIHKKSRTCPVCGTTIPAPRISEADQNFAFDILDLDVEVLRDTSQRGAVLARVKNYVAEKGKISNSKLEAMAETMFDNKWPIKKVKELARANDYKEGWAYYKHKEWKAKKTMNAAKQIGEAADECK